MARERIISLRNLSQEDSPQAMRTKDDSRLRESRLHVSSVVEGNTTEEEAERLQLLMRSPASHRRSGSRPPVLVVVEDYSSHTGPDHPRLMTGAEEKKKKSRQSVYSHRSSAHHTEHSSIVTQHHEVDEEDDDRRTLATAPDEDDDDHPLIIKHGLADLGPILSAAGDLDTIHAEKPARFSLEAVDSMGHFMNQASTISTRIDGLEAELLENTSSFSNHPAFRTALYSKIDLQIVQQILLLHTTHRLDSNPSLTPDVVVVDDDDDHRHDDRTLEKRRLTPSTQEIEHALKVEQIVGLTTKAKSLVSGLIARLNDEKQITTNQIEYEWNKELSRASTSSRHSRSVSTILDPEHLANPDCSPDHQLFEKLQLIDHHPRSSQFYSDEVQKILNLAVRSSTSYPEARKSSLFIKSKVDSVLQMNAEVELLSRFLNQLSSDPSGHYAHDGTSATKDEEEDGDDLSSISISLDGLDDEDKGRRPAPQIQTRKKPNKIRFKIGDRPKKTPRNRTGFVEDLEHNRAGNKEPQCHRLSYGSNVSYSLSFHDNRPWVVRYRLTICCSMLAFVLLISMACLIYFNLKSHND